MHTRDGVPLSINVLLTITPVYSTGHNVEGLSHSQQCMLIPALLEFFGHMHFPAWASCVHFAKRSVIDRDTR